MKLVAVKYVGEDKVKYDSYKALSEETRKGDDWNNELDADLKHIKSTIKKTIILKFKITDVLIVSRG